MVRTIDRCVREITSDHNTALCELSSRTQDTRLFRCHAHLGNYAEHVCNLLKGLDKNSPVEVLTGPWTDIVKTLDARQDRVASWIARGCQGPQPRCPEMDAIDQGKEYIEHEGISRHFVGPGNISQFSHLDGKKATSASKDSCQ